VELAGHAARPAPLQEDEKSATGTQPDCRLNQSIAHRLFLLFVALRTLKLNTVPEVFAGGASIGAVLILTSDFFFGCSIHHLPASSSGTDT
jgi:hypothetical protein